MFSGYRIVVGLAICAAILASGCSPSREEIASKVKQSMQSRMDTDPAFADSRIKILKVMVIHEAGNKYQGLAVVQTKTGAEHQVPVQVVGKRPANPS